MGHLLLADDRSFERLRCESGLPSDLFTNHPATGGPPADQDRVVYERRDPEVVAPLQVRKQGEPQQAEEPDDYEAKEEFFAELLGSIICHLVVVENKPSEEENLKGEDHVTLRGATDLGALTRWYEEFARQAEKYVHHRSGDYEHVLILVCGDEIKPDDEELREFQELFQRRGGDRPFDVCYVLLRKLEVGERGVVFANYVWPLVVGRLLVYLLHGIPNPPDDTAQARIWRDFELEPQVSSDLIEGQYQQRMGEAYTRLVERVEPGAGQWDDTILQSGYKPVSVVGMELEGETETDVLWESPGAAHRRTGEVTGPDRLSGELERTGGQFARGLARAAIGLRSPSWEDVTEVWLGVHRKPQLISLARKLALQSPQRGEQGDESGSDPIQAGLQKVRSRWEKMLRIMRERQTMLHAARRCAGILAEARQAFVGWRPRLVFAAVAVMLVGYLCWGVLYGVGQNLPVALIGSAGAAAAALVAAALPHWIENKRGYRGAEELAGQLRRLDEKLDARHQASQRCLDGASALWQKMRAASAARRLRLLLERVGNMLEHELQYRAPRTRLREEDVRTEDLPQSSRRQSWSRHRKHYLDNTTLTHPVVLDRVEETQVEEVVDVQVEQFCRDVWFPFCDHWDTCAAGHLPARRLIPLLREFHQNFRLAIVSEINGQAIHWINEQQRDPTKGHGEPWAKGIQEILNQDYYYYMSAVITREQMGDTVAVLLRRHDLEIGPELDALGDGRERSRIMPHLGVAGYFHQEASVELGRDSDGKLGVIGDEG